MHHQHLSWSITDSDTSGITQIPAASISHMTFWDRITFGITQIPAVSISHKTHPWIEIYLEYEYGVYDGCHGYSPLWTQGVVTPKLGATRYMVIISVIVF